MQTTVRTIYNFFPGYAVLHIKQIVQSERKKNKPEANIKQYGGLQRSYRSNSYEHFYKFKSFSLAFAKE